MDVSGLLRQLYERQDQMSKAFQEDRVLLLLLLYILNKKNYHQRNDNIPVGEALGNN